MMLKIGLTGSIGMGKSTTAELFAEFGAAIHDADEAIRRLYAAGGAGVPVIASLAPEAVVEGAVDRARLRSAVVQDGTLLKKLEAALHPLVTKDRNDFVERSEAQGRLFVVFDIPLLYETGAEVLCDVVVVVSAPAAIQRARVLARPGMTEAALDTILARQTPDHVKRAKADAVIDTSQSIDDARRQVLDLILMFETRFDLNLLEKGIK